MARLTEERCIAAFLGCAVGDTLGMPVESFKPEQIKRYVGRITRPIAPVIVRDSAGKRIFKDEFGKLKCWNKGSEPGGITDDTILTMAIAESIIATGRLDIDAAARSQLAHYLGRQLPDGTFSGGFGKTTAEAFRRVQLGIPLEWTGEIGGPGTAPPMKMAPVGLYMVLKDAYHDGLDFARDVGRMTHLDPRSIAAGVVQAHAVYEVAKGRESKASFVESLLEVCRGYEKPVKAPFLLHQAGSLADRLDWVCDNGGASDEKAYAALKCSSNVFEAYPFAMFMFQKYWDDPVEGLLAAVNFGGDCDTTGAIFGALAGARHGDVFPKEWTSMIKERDHLVELGKGMYALGQRKL